MSHEIVQKQEAALQFREFSNAVGIEVGLELIGEARRLGQAVAVDVSRCGHQIFHASLDGTSPDIDRWLERKRNTVYRTFAATMGLQYRLKAAGVSLADAFHLDPAEFVDSGGGFPVVVRGAGFVGAIVVSGTSDRQEHDLITSVLSRYLAVPCPELPNR